MFTVPLFYCFTVAIHNYGLRLLVSCCKWSNMFWESFIYNKANAPNSFSFPLLCLRYCWRFYSIHLKYLTACAVLQNQVPWVVCSLTQHKTRPFYVMCINLFMQTFLKIWRTWYLDKHGMCKCSVVWFL